MDSESDLYSATSLQKHPSVTTLSTTSSTTEQLMDSPKTIMEEEDSSKFPVFVKGQKSIFTDEDEIYPSNMNDYYEGSSTGRTSTSASATKSSLQKTAIRPGIFNCDPENGGFLF